MVFLFFRHQYVLTSAGTQQRTNHKWRNTKWVYWHYEESEPFPPHSLDGVKLGTALLPELADRMVKAATERESTHRFSTKWQARSRRLLNVTPSSFCAHSQIRQDAADTSSSSEWELLLSCNTGSYICEYVSKSKFTMRKSAKMKVRKC